VAHVQLILANLCDLLDEDFGTSKKNMFLREKDAEN
jgi:hypothetical protein